MELSDVVYLILMLGFVVFGIFNDSKKKKRKLDSSTESLNGDEDESEVRDVFRDIFKKFEQQHTPPPTPVATSTTKRKQPTHEKRFKQSAGAMDSFESSMSLVTNFERESSLKDFRFANESLEVSDFPDTDKTVHPLLNDLTGGDIQAEIRKAILYSEILNRKY